MPFAFGHGQTVVVGSEASLKNRVAIDQQVMRCNGRTEKAVAGAHEIDGVASRDVFENDRQLREIRVESG